MDTLKYNLINLDSLKCFILAKYSENEISFLQKESLEYPILHLESGTELKSVLAICRYLWDPLFNFKVTEWLEFSKFEIRPYVQGEITLGKLKHSLSILNNHLARADSLYLIDSKISLADVSLFMDLCPVFINNTNESVLKEEYPCLFKWRRNIMLSSPVKNYVEQILSIINKDTSIIKISSRKTKKILCIHGYRQNASSFKSKTGGFRKLCGKNVEFFFLDAPHLISNTEERSWWFSSNKKTYSAFETTTNIGLDQSIELIKQKLQDDLFDGILCFSQGASLIAWLATHLQLEKRIRFIIFVAAFKSGSLEYCTDKGKSRLRTLHVFGETDQVIPIDKSLEILDFFRDYCVIRHSGGHFLPTKSSYKEIYQNFIYKDE